MKVYDILPIIEYGTKLRIYVNELVYLEGILDFDDEYYNTIIKQYGNKTIVAINTADDTIDIELVIK